MPTRLTTREFLARLQARNAHVAGGELSVTGTYRSSTTPIECRCNLCGYVWRAHPQSLMRGAGCLRCARKKASLAGHEAQKVTPEQFRLRVERLCPTIELVGGYKGGNRKIEARCKDCGYTWSPFPATLLRACSCPACTNRVVVPGQNDLATTNPEIAAEWDCPRNGGLTPEDVVAGSAKKVWWVCSKGHEWQAEVYRRKAGQTCPICRRISKTEF